MIEQKLNTIQSEIAQAAQRSHRYANEILLIAVSKKKPSQLISRAFHLGIRHFGENYWQEAELKRESLHQLPIVWHFIGRLQSNKVKKIVGQFEFIHSVDRLGLAEQIDRCAELKAIRQKILLEVNMAGEGSKGGFSLDSLMSSWPRLRELSHIEVSGLMTMPPLGFDREASRPFFARLRKLQQDLKLDNVAKHPLEHLSMGTSHDFTVAVEEGATMVRIGTAIFGTRET